MSNLIIDDRVFIINNLFSKNELDYLVDLSNHMIKSEEFCIRGYYNNNPIKTISYKNLDEKSKEKYDNMPFNAHTNEKYYEMHFVKDKFNIELTNKIFESLKSIYSDTITSFNDYRYISNILFYGDNHNMRKHTDNFEKRICTSVLYLNDKPEFGIGGEVVFYNDDEEPIYIYQPKVGDLIIFDNLKKGIIHSVNKIKNWNRMVYRTYWEKNNL